MRAYSLLLLVETSHTNISQMSVMQYTVDYATGALDGARARSRARVCKCWVLLYTNKYIINQSTV